MSGKKNLIIGALWVFLFTALGFILEMKLRAGDVWLKSVTRELWRTAHLHGGTFGILNLVYGLILLKVSGLPKIAAVGSWLAVLGALIFPTSLFLAGITMPAAYAAPVGGACMIAAWACMFFALLAAKKPA